MSTIKVNKIENTSTTAGGVAIDSSGHVQVDGLQMPTAGTLSNRNLIINGAMNVAQRGTSFTGISSGSAYPADRFKLNAEFGTFDAVNSSTAPSGFSNSIKVDCTTAGTPAATTNENFLEHVIEAQNLQQLQYGESAANSSILSFYVRSNKTGSYGLWLFSSDGNRQYATTYSISAADTWEYKTITIPGDVSGTINNDNGAGLNIRWYLGAGSSYTGTPAETWEAVGANRTTSLNFADSTANEWLLTGVQLEVGEKATPYEHRAYGDELARCQRYTFVGRDEDGVQIGFMNGHMWSATGFIGVVHYPVAMRAAPDVTVADASHLAVYSGGQADTVTSFSDQSQGKLSCEIVCDIGTSRTVGRGAWIRFVSGASSTSKVVFDAEL